MNNNNIDILYHYTSEKGLKGILESQTLWSTHYKKMRNDEKELRHFHEYLRGKLSKKQNKTFNKSEMGIIIENLNDVFHNFLNGTERSVSPEIYVTCFCPDGNSILLRKEYGDYSIGFDKKEIDNLRKMEIKKFRFDMSMFNPVIYDGSNKPKYFEDEIDEIINILDNYVNRGIDDRNKCSLNYLLNVTLFKSDQYSDEHEYRLVVGKLFPEIQPSTKTVKYRGNDQSIPYIELFDDKDILLPMREIIIGSSLDYKSEKKWIEELLKEKDLDNTVKISMSTF